MRFDVDDERKTFWFDSEKLHKEEFDSEVWVRLELISKNRDLPQSTIERLRAIAANPACWILSIANTHNTLHFLLQFHVNKSQLLSSSDNEQWSYFVRNLLTDIEAIAAAQK